MSSNSAGRAIRAGRSIETAAFAWSDSPTNPSKADLLLVNQELTFRGLR